MSAPDATTAAPLNPGSFALVAAGGSVGSAARYGVDQALGTAGGWPVGTLTVNLVGAFLLGVLVTSMSAHKAARLFLGTGLLGGFTTYSAFAVETDQLLRDGRAGLALAYVLTTVVVGLVASVAGIILARKASR